MTNQQVLDIWAGCSFGRRFVGECASFEAAIEVNDLGLVEIEREIDLGCEGVDHQYAIARAADGQRWVLCRWFYDGWVEAQPVLVDWERRVGEYFESADRFMITAVFDRGAFLP